MRDAQKDFAEEGGSSQAPRRQKKAYAKPSFRCDQVFETMALSCQGKVDPTQQSCKVIPTKNS